MQSNSANANEYSSVAIHRQPNFLNGCVEVLQEEWGRSASARLSMLEKSCDSFPYSLVLLRREPGTSKLEVIGHSRLCRVHAEPRAAFVESVVIRKCLRGKGLGRLLMTETEAHAERLGVDVLYLTTHDKQEFYQHVGYRFCEPVISFGSASKILSDDRFANLLGKLSSDVQKNGTNKVSLDKTTQALSATPPPLAPITVPPPPPPPLVQSTPPLPIPPPPRPVGPLSSENISAPMLNVSSWMKKVIRS